MPTKATLCIFEKAPLSGLVKTRLAPFLTTVEAAGLAAAFFADTFALASSCDWARVVVACDGDPSLLEIAPDTEVWPQGPGDLGERMERALSLALESSKAAIIIGTDLPGLPRRFLDSAHFQLTGHDAIIGPSADGGFYLLGLQRCPSGLLRGIPWQSATTREHTVERLYSIGLTVAEAEPWFDVDEPTDLVRLAGLLREERIWAPRTAGFLTGLRHCL
ncbi:MAG TPA: TIGR04282 family arsenosugar biosynthesis glycosyltransferase [Polyangia bacterium]